MKCLFELSILVKLVYKLSVTKFSPNKRFKTNSTEQLLLIQSENTSRTAVQHLFQHNATPVLLYEYKTNSNIAVAVWFNRVFDYLYINLDLKMYIFLKDVVGF